jgi:putative spermidine/putrescine transport system substrate-binding protein/spermidine/putrescine transport system substrate-binding protein
VSQIPDDRHTRRNFIAWSASALAGLGVASASSYGASPSAQRLRAATASTTLEFVGWQGYDGTPTSTFPILANWEQQQGISLAPVYIDTNETIITKLAASPAGTYDLVTPYHGTVPEMIAAGLLEPINTKALKNWNAVLPSLRAQSYLRDTHGKIYAVPLGFGYIQVQVYNPALISRPPTSYADVLKPEFKGKFTLKDAQETFFWIAKVLGLGHPDPHHLTHAELAKCVAYARKVLAAARTLATSYGDIFQLLVTKEVAFSLSATPDDVTRAAAQGVTLKQFYPKEGAQSYVDNYSIPKNAPHATQALAFIDAMIGARVNAELAAVYGGGVSNLSAVPDLTPTLRGYYPYKHISSFFGKLAPLYPPVPVTSNRYATYSDWTTAWEQAKA